MIPITASTPIGMARSVGAVGEHRQADPQEAVDAGLAHHRGQQHGHEDRRRAVGARQPAVERPQRQLDREGQGEAGEQPGALGLGEGDADQVLDHEGELAGDVLGHERRGQDRHQHQQAADHRVDHEAGRRPAAPLAAPHPDQEVERDQHRLPEDVEEHELAGGEERRAGRSRRAAPSPGRRAGARAGASRPRRPPAGRSPRSGPGARATGRRRPRPTTGRPPRPSRRVSTYCRPAASRSKRPIRIAVSTRVPPAGDQGVDARLQRAGGRRRHGEHGQRPDQGEQDDGGDPGHAATASPA